MDVFINFACDLTSDLASLINNDSNKMLAFFQCFFNYSSAERLEDYPRFFRSVRPIQSVEMLFYMTKIAAPLLFRLMNNHELLGEVRMKSNRTDLISLFWNSSMGSLISTKLCITSMQPDSARSLEIRPKFSYYWTQ